MDKKRVGWIGTGVMGHSMCSHIVPLAKEVHLYNRSAKKMQPLVEMGAIAHTSPKEVSANSSIVFTIVGYPEDVEEVYFGKEGLFAGAQPNTIFVDMTTSKPSLALKINQEATRLGCFSLDAPVSGGDIGAQTAQLSIMVGGEESSFKAVEPFFAAMGKTYTLQGGPGAGQHTKMANQIVIAGTMIGVCEALLYGKRANLNTQQLVETIRGGAAGCWTLDNLAPRMLKGNFDPGFMIQHFVKDMGIALEEAKKMGLALPGLALVEQLYIALESSGGGSLGTQALILALEHLSSQSLAEVIHD